MISTKEQDEKYLSLLTQRKRSVIEMESNLHTVGEKYKDIEEKVRIQRELIGNILKEQTHTENPLYDSQSSE
jgi:hypothetical protein